MKATFLSGNERKRSSGGTRNAGATRRLFLNGVLRGAALAALGAFAGVGLARNRRAPAASAASYPCGTCPLAGRCAVALSPNSAACPAGKGKVQSERRKSSI